MSDHEDTSHHIHAHGIEIAVDISATDGVPVVFIDTEGVEDGPSGPAIRVRLNDEPIWNGTEQFEQTGEAELLAALKGFVAAMESLPDSDETNLRVWDQYHIAVDTIAKAKGE